MTVLVTHAPLYRDWYDNTSTSYVATDFPCWWNYTAANWDGTVSVYLEVDASVTSGGTWYAQLYRAGYATAVTGADVSGTETSTTRKRSGEFKANLTDGWNYEVRVKTTSGATSTLRHARVVIVQSGTITKTETYIPMVSATDGQGPNVNMQTHDATAYVRWDSAAFDGATVYFEATAKKVYQYSTYGWVELYDQTSSTSITYTGSFVSNPSASQRLRSAAVSLTDAHDYMVRHRTSGQTIYTANAQLVVVQTGFTLTQKHIEVSPYDQTTSTSDVDYPVYSLWDTTNEWSSDEGRTVYHESTITNSNSSYTTTVGLNDGTSDVSSSDVTTTSTTRSRQRSGAITLTNSSVYHGQIRTSNASGTATRFGSRIIVNVGMPQTISADLLTVTPTFYSPAVVQNIAANLLTVTPTLYQPAVSSSAGGQTVNANLLTVAPTLYQPKVVQNVNANLLSASTTLYSPQVSQNIAANLLTTTPTLYAPQVSLQTAVPLLSASVTAYQPQVTTSTSVVANLLTASLTLYQPAVSQRIAANLLTAAATLYAPGISTGSVTIAANLLTVSPTMYAPAVALGSTIQPNLLTVAPTLYQPSVSTGAVSVTANLLTVAATMYAPAVALQTAVPLLTIAATLYQPQVTVGAVTVQASLLTVAPTLYQPQVSAGGASVTTPLLTATPTLYQPAVTTTATVAVPLLTATTTLYQPQVAPRTAVPLLTIAPTVYQPQVAPGAVTVVAPLLTVTASLYEPAVSTGVTVAVPLLSAAATLYQPALNTQTGITAPLLTVTVTLYMPAVSAGAVTVTAPLLAALAVLYAPAVLAYALDPYPNHLTTRGRGHVRTAGAGQLTTDLRSSLR